MDSNVVSLREKTVMASMKRFLATAESDPDYIGTLLNKHASHKDLRPYSFNASTLFILGMVAGAIGCKNQGYFAFIDNVRKGDEPYPDCKVSDHLGNQRKLWLE